MFNLFDLPAQVMAKAQQYAERGSAELHYLQKMISAGAFRPEPPQNLAAMVADIRRWGEVGMIPRSTPAAPRQVGDHRRRGIADLLRTRRCHQRARQRTAGDGVKGGDGVAILARNHRWFTIANYAGARVGARTILLNTEFSGPQIKDVSEREGAKVIIYDEEYAEAVKLADPPLGKLRALGVNPDAAGPPIGEHETLAEVIARSSTAPRRRPPRSRPSSF